LGNVGDPADPATVAVLRRWTGSGDDLLAEHARWAAGRLGLLDGSGGAGGPDGSPPSGGCGQPDLPDLPEGPVGRR
ncbi:MAG TPA: hypothetical protein VKW77_10565, partial [Acidimicrobiales bacterium]|nr:hypothetical protein [Acidimicrobiales bacterium]